MNTTDNDSPRSSATSWFQASHEDHGEATVFFEGYDEPLRGTGTVRISELGEVSFEIKVTSIGSLPSGLSDAESRQLAEILVANRVEVATATGVYTSSNLPDAAYWWDPTTTFSRLDITPQYTRYSTYEHGAVHYWTTPLINFRALFLDHPRELTSHPLLLEHVRQTFETYSTHSDIEILHHRSAFDGVIVFPYANEMAFIQPLDEYEALRNRLQCREIESAITALMVGCTDSGINQETDFHELYARGFCSSLSLAAGILVAIPWIEFRSASGHLIERQYRRWSAPRFTESNDGGAVRSDEQYEANRTGVGGIGGLISTALRNEYFGNISFYVAVRRWLKSQYKSSSIDDRYDQLCRAVETLFILLAPPSSSPLILLDRSTHAAIDNILSEASAKLRTLGNHIKATLGDQASEALAKIAHRVRTDSKSITKPSNTGEKLILLLNLFALKDARIVEQYNWPTKNYPDIRWRDMISLLRNDVAHRGHLASIVQDNTAIYRVYKHLTDIVLRILLLVIGYDGPYSSKVGAESGKDVRWVTADLDIRSLGYKKTDATLANP